MELYEILSLITRFTFKFGINKFNTIIMFIDRKRSKSSSSKRPNFQIRYKTRNKMLTQSAECDTSLNKTSKSYYLKQNQEDCQRENKSFAHTAMDLTNKNFSHHSEGNCCCKSCTCGRHLCKFNVIKPSFTKHTIYKRSYYKQKHIQNTVNHSKEYERLKGPLLQLNSTYSQGFKQSKGDPLSRPHPRDSLYLEGPSQQLTSYSTQFPGFHGDNQYVKPTEKHSIAYFPIRSKTTYSSEFKKRYSKRVETVQILDQIKKGSNWYGQTTYDNFYNQPDPEYFAKKVTVIEKLQENPNYHKQYQTIYKNDFVQKGNPLCPAKILLETKGKGLFRQSISTLAQNSDFKAFSPNYQAISNSKHSYV